MANYRSAEQEKEFQAKVLFAAARLFLKKGYTFTSLKEIADEAGVNINSMKQFFGLKENILAKLVKYVLEGQFKATVAMSVTPVDGAGVDVTLTIE